MDKKKMLLYAGVAFLLLFAGSSSALIDLTGTYVASGGGTTFDQDLNTTDAPTFATVDTGQGANELYDMNQNVLTTSDVVFGTVQGVTQAEFNTLTDNSIANALHRHTELVASDGNPDPALSVDSIGRVIIGPFDDPEGTLELRTGNSIMRIRDMGNTATETTSYIEFGGTTRNIPAVTFAGSGLNDCISGGTFTGNADISYKIEIDATNGTDTFKWSDDGGSTWDVERVIITGGAQTLNNGVTVTFGATTGHTVTDYWGFTATASWNRTGYVGDGSSGDTHIRLCAEDSDLILGDSSGASVLTLSGGNVNISGDLYVAGTIINDAIYAQLSDSTDQTFAATGTGYAITFNTNDEINGITHSTVSETANITIVTDGVYSIFAQPQVHADPGASGYFHMWLRKDTGGGFVDIANTNVELILSSNGEDVIPLIVSIRLDAGDVIRVNASVAHTGIELDAQTPANEPAIPSIIFTMYRIGA